MDKKGQVLQNLGSLAVGIATLAIVLTVTFLILAQGQEQSISIEGTNPGCNWENTTSCGTAYNATGVLAEAVDDIPGWVPLIVIAVIGSILLGLVAMFRK